MIVIHKINKYKSISLLFRLPLEEGLTFYRDWKQFQQLTFANIHYLKIEV